MTYAVSYGLQAALYGALVGDAALNALVGTNIFDAPPSGSVPGAYVVLGDEVAKDRSSKTHRGAMHELIVSVVSDAAGFSEAKQVAAAVCDVLIGADLTLSRGSLVSFEFLSARAIRDDFPDQRQIRLRFRSIVFDD